MPEKEPEAHRRASFDRFKSVKRKALHLSEADLVETQYLEDHDKSLLMVRPRVERLCLSSWAESNRNLIDGLLLKHGGLLFRGFGVVAPQEFGAFIDAAAGPPLEYNERSSPRTLVGENIYTSTDHPFDHQIFLHNEQSYNLTFPMRISFCCVKPAQQGGQTPIADTRRIYERIRPEIRANFKRRKYTYARSFGDGFGLSWKEAFQTSDKLVVERYCAMNEIETEWMTGDRLRTRQVRKTAARHPQSGEMVWFNHMVFFNVSTLEPRVRDALLEQFSEETLPNNTFYGDGALIEPLVLEELRSAYEEEKFSFDWETGDVLILDNMLKAHGRNSFVGDRKVLAGMAMPWSWAQLEE
jgi:alpha-ketoglutarate-dependent taurine dioxygenase